MILEHAPDLPTSVFLRLTLASSIGAIRSPCTLPRESPIVNARASGMLTETAQLEH